MKGERGRFSLSGTSHLTITSPYIKNSLILPPSFWPLIHQCSTTSSLVPILKLSPAAFILTVVDRYPIYPTCGISLTFPELNKNSTVTKTVVSKFDSQCSKISTLPEQLCKLGQLIARNVKSVSVMMSETYTFK